MSEKIYPQNCIKQQRRLYLNAFNSPAFTRKNIPLVIISGYALILLISLRKRCDEPHEQALLLFTAAFVVFGARHLCLRWLSDHTKYVRPLDARFIVNDELICYRTETIRNAPEPVIRETVFRFSELETLGIDTRRHVLRFKGAVSFNENGKELNSLTRCTVAVTYAFNSRSDEAGFFKELQRIKEMLDERDDDSEKE